MSKKKKTTATKIAPSREAANDGGKGLSRAFTTALIASLIAISALVAYRNSFSTPFIFDDIEAIVENPTVHRLGTAFDPPAQQGTTVAGRPLLALSFAINHALGGLDVRGYHAVNLALHVLAGLTLFGLVRRILESQRLRERFERDASWIAGAIALLWTVHPLQTESVTYIVQRAESLAGLFYLLTLYAFVRSIESPRALTWRVVSFAACALGVASKEVVATAPLVVLLCDRSFFVGTFREALRARWRFHAALASTWLLLAWLVWQTGARGGTVGFSGDITPWTYALKQCEAIVRYLGLAVWPHPLVFDFGTDIVRAWTTVWPQALALMLLAGASCVAIVRRPQIGFVGCCFFALLAPTSSLIPVATQTMAEHRMYLPLAAVIAALVVVLWKFLGRRGLVVVVPVVLAFATVTIARNSDYRSAVSIWKDTVEKRPGNARAHSALGEALQREGRAREAMVSLERALAIDPLHITAHGSLGNALLQLRRVDEAIAHFQIAVRMRPDDFKLHGNLGNALLAAGRFAEAIAEQRTMLRLAPALAETHYNLALSLARAEQHAEAINEFRAALRIEPKHAEALLNLATSLAMSGRGEDAISACREAVRLRPNWVEARCNLGLLFAQAGRFPDAIACYEEALRLAPGRGDVRSMLQQLRAQAAR